MNQGRYYFRNSYEGAPNDARSTLQNLIDDSSTIITPTARRWLLTRGLINDDGKLLIPVLASFLKRERDLN